MTRLTQTASFENEISSIIGAFFRTFGIRAILKRTGVHKTKGVPAVMLFQELFSLVFHHKTLFRHLASSVSGDTGKDTFYRFVNSSIANWMRFTTLLAAKAVNDVIEPLIDEKRVNVFIVDDTPYERTARRR
ncbi:MAG: transposase [Synergistaceae bacterium]|nr:transposase [Synergistaceae bacterium]